MNLFQSIKQRFRPESVSLDLHDIQALILRSRPEPYVGVHAMLHFDEAEGARDLLGRLAPHIASADNWSDDLDFWIGAALSFEGLKALGVPDQQLKTFPLPFQQGMAARAEQLRDFGPNAPENWKKPSRRETVIWRSRSMRSTTPHSTRRLRPRVQSSIEARG